MSHRKEFQHLKIPLEAILSSTSNFSEHNCIGKGGFGKVYKGEIIHSKGQSTVAFKRLDRAFGQGDPEFWKEIMMLSVYSHENIVSLLGFCDESDEKILVYEYASKGSLDLYLENDDLSWIQRLKICIGAARGLAYLHNPIGTHLRVLHRDIKSSNILIDENWNAKISDFGLSKLGPVNHRFSFFVSNAVGTIGYCDPLYVESGFLTKESDVYSFGVVLFEVLCGRLCFSSNDNHNDKYQPFTQLARESYEENKISEIIHRNLKDQIHHGSLKLFTSIAYQCLKRDREERPLMTKITATLETALEYQINHRQPAENDGSAAETAESKAVTREVNAETTQIKDTKQNWQFDDFQECYLQKRRYWARQAQKQEEKGDCNPIQREAYQKDFQSSRLQAVAQVRQLFPSTNIVSSIEFDRDGQLFATAGVSRCIEVFEFSALLNKEADVQYQYPIVEISTGYKLSCLSWNKYTNNHLASSDYWGIVTVWDVATLKRVIEYEEHEKRAWSVDFSRTEPTMLVSGSDDCKVKVWCTKQQASVFNIDMKANICSAKYNPGSSFHIAVGSADHDIHYFDLRNISRPLHIFSGHRKSVSYVNFISNSELASASTDSTLRLWDVKENTLLRTFRGHTNVKNFVGLTVNNDYIACGSETNEVFVYHKDMSWPAASHRFHSETNEGEEDPESYFISAVCWKSDSPTMLTANSQGTIKVLALAA